jgi:glycosyltransferase involved in cell wall biosynthesis
MAASKPIVATAVNGCTEIVADGESGFLVPPGDIPAWANKVMDLLEDPRRAATMGKKARRRVEQRYSIETTTTLTIELYHRLLRDDRLDRDAL